MVAVLVLFISLGMLAFGLDFTFGGHDLGAGLPLLAAGLYGTWQVATTPVRLSIEGGWVRTYGLRGAAARTADLASVEVAGSWRGPRLRMLGRDGQVAIELDAALFDQRQLLAALAGAGVSEPRPRGRPARRPSRRSGPGAPP